MLLKYNNTNSINIERISCLFDLLIPFTDRSNEIQYDSQNRLNFYCSLPFGKSTKPKNRSSVTRNYLLVLHETIHKRFIAMQWVAN